MNILEKLGLAVRDGVYETFLTVTDTTDLKELREAGYKVTELQLSIDGLDRLYILHTPSKPKNVIKVGCTIEWDHETQEPIVKVHTPLETKEILRHVASGKRQLH